MHPVERDAPTASYARPRASAKSVPRPTTVSTRPPAVTIAPSRPAVPAWNTSAPGRGRFVEAGDELAGLEPLRVAARRQDHADVTVAARPEHAGLEPGRRAACQQVREQVFVEAGQHDLGLGIAHAAR